MHNLYVIQTQIITCKKTAQMTNNLAKTENIQEKALVSVLLFEAVGESSAAIDSFSNWLLIGFAGAITFLIGNLDSLSGHLPPATLHCCISLFLVVASLGIAEKILATVIAGARAGAAIGREMGAEIASRGIELDVSVIFSQTETAILQPMRWFVKRSFQKAISGDIAATSRTITKWAQIQGALALIQALTILWAVYIIARSLIF